MWRVATPEVDGVARLQVHGDAWVGRIFDNEDDFKRLDFKLAELSSSAPWVVKAAQQMRAKAQAEAPQAVLQRMEAERKAKAAAAAAPPKASVKELTATEAAKVLIPPKEPRAVLKASACMFCNARKGTWPQWPEGASACCVLRAVGTCSGLCKARRVRKNSNLPRTFWRRHVRGCLLCTRHAC